MKRFLIAVLLLVGPVSAMAPGNWTAMGVVAPSSANANVPGGSYVAPLFGAYFIRTGLINPSWLITPAAHPQAKDPTCLGAASIAIAFPSDASGTWCSIICTQPGWIQVKAVSGAVQDIAYYRLYRIEILEDDVGGHSGYDPAYGKHPTWPTIYSNLGGPNINAAPAARDTREIDLRWDGPYFTLLWDGSPPLGGGSWLSRWNGMAWLDKLPEAPMNSLMATTRDEQYVRVYLEGPRDQAGPGVGYDNGFEVALRLSRPNANTTGDIYPGIGGQGSGGCQIVAEFKPPQPLLNGVPQLNGKFRWPDAWGPAATNPQIPVARFDVTDVSNPAAQRKWILHFPWRGKTRSKDYADIEVEARIPPKRVFAGGTMGAGQAQGADPTGMEEGCMQLRWGTVVELDEIDEETVEPEGVDIGELRTHWYRQVSEYVKDINYFDPVTGLLKDDVRSEHVALSLGVKTVTNGGIAREPDTGGATHAKLYVKRDLAEADENGQYYIWEVMWNLVGIKYGVVQEPWGDATWTQSDVPEDCLNWMDSGTNTRPKSIDVKFRGYVGQIPNSPYGDKVYSSLGYAADFDVEPAEITTLGTPPTPDNRDRIVTVHFINARADVNNDGLLDDLDESDMTEEGASGEAGLLLNGYDNAGTPSGGGAVDPELRELQLRFSIPTAAEDYENYSVRIETTDLELAFWKQNTRQTKLDRSENEGTVTWTVPHADLADDGTQLSVWASTTYLGTTTASTMVRMFLVSPQGKRVALDEIKFTMQGWGLTVDSDNDGTIDLWDEQAEEDPNNKMRMIAGLEYELQVWKHLKIDKYGTGTPAAATVTLKKSGAGRVSIKDHEQAVFFPAPPATEVTEKTIDLDDLDGQGHLAFTMTGHEGEVTLTLEVAVGQQVVSRDTVRLQVITLAIDEVGFTGDHTITIWDAATSPAATDVVIDETDGTEATWERVGNPDHPVCYTKSAKPTLFGKIEIDPAVSTALELDVRIKVGGTTYAQVTMTLNGSEASFSGFAFSSSLESTVTETEHDFVWEFAPKGTGSTETWASAGTSTGHKFFWVNATPITPTFTSQFKTTSWDTLYDLALDRACNYVDGNSDIIEAATDGLEADITYDPIVRLPPDTHPLEFYDRASSHMQCAENASLLRGLLKSLGVSAAQKYIYVGRATGAEVRYIWIFPPGAGATPPFYPSAQFNHASYEESRETNPHFAFHSLVYAGGKYYDPSFGDTAMSVAATILEPDLVAGGAINPVNGEVLRVVDTSIVFRDPASHTSWLVNPATGVPWVCHH